MSKDRLFDLSRITAHDGGEIGWEVLAGDDLLLVVTPEDSRLSNHSGKVIAETLARCLLGLPLFLVGISVTM